MFQETEVSGEIYCHVPKHVVQYVPTKSVSVQHLEGVRPIQVRNEYLYIASSLLPKVSDIVAKQLDLQDEVAKCKRFIHDKFFLRNYLHLIQTL